MLTIFTAGHGTRSFTDFIDLLLAVDFELLVDVRSRPRSRYSWFNKSRFEIALGDRYRWMPMLGGLDDTITEKEFQSAIGELVELAKVKRVVLMCSEKEPQRCHRHTKLEPEIRLRGFNVIHL